MVVQLNKEKCTGCGTCADVCPNEAIKINETAEIDEENCVECGACVDECPSEALSLPE
jgi:ferredoxin